MKNFEYAQPKKIDDVFQYLGADNTKIKAGGIDALDLMKEGIVKPNRLVNIRNIDQLSFVKENLDGSISLGPTITISELIENSIVQKYFPSLIKAAELIATPQIRNSATLGGNLCQKPRCWYYRSGEFNCSRKGGDECFALIGENKYHAILGNDHGCVIVHPSATAVALTSLGAQIKISDGDNVQMVNIEDFYIKPENDYTRENILSENQLIIEIILSKNSKECKSNYLKLKEKDSFDWPLADVAISLKIIGGICNDAKIVLGSAAPIPWRSKEAENILIGKKITKAVARKAAGSAMRNASSLGQNGYKITLFKTIIFRAICQTVGLDPYS